jgi:hypothetical protein
VNPKRRERLPSNQFEHVVGTHEDVSRWDLEDCTPQQRELGSPSWAL